MSVKNLIIGSICCAILAPSIALAESKSRENAELKQNRRIIFDYAKCVVKQRHAQAAEAILSNAGNGTIQKEFSDLIIPDCAVSAVGEGVAITFGGDLYRYALADALVNSEYAKTSESDFSNRLPLAHVLAPKQSELDAFLAANQKKRKREEAQAYFDKITRIEWLSRFGECVVRKDPITTRLWLLTPTDALEETSRINELRPAFSACLAQGTVKFDRFSVRGTVALNYYRLAKASIQPAMAKAN